MPLFTLTELENASPLFRGRCGNALGRGLMRLLSIDKVNDLYDRNISLSGTDFTAAVLRDIGVGYEIRNPDVLQHLPDGPFITISNHPYGSIDGIMLLDIFGRVRPDFNVMVNRILGRIHTLENNFICVTPTGNERHSPSGDSIRGVKAAMAHVRAGHPLGIFPSGAVSDLSIRDRSIRDREWQEPVIRLIKKLNVPIVPVYFMDRNSDFFYMLGLIDWKVRLLRMPAEVFNKRGRRERVALGPIIIPQQQAEFGDVRSFGDFLRNKVYNL